MGKQKEANEAKEHKGRITNWWKLPQPGHGKGYAICGMFLDHPDFAGKNGFTSYVVKHDLKTDEIETLNSRYLLVDKAEIAND